MSKVLDFRLAHEGDLAFVVDSWLASYRGAHAAGLIRMSTWHSVMEPEIKAVLARPGAEVWVAFCPEAPAGDADLYGWLCYEKEVKVHQRELSSWPGYRVTKNVVTPLVHYLYVKQPYRRSGVARGLLAHVGIGEDSHFLFTCKTGIIAKLLSPGAPFPKYPMAKWGPLVARYPKEEQLDEATSACSSGIRPTD